MMASIDQKTLLLFELPNHKIIYKYNLNRHIACTIGKLRINKKTFVNLSQETWCISEEPIEIIEKVSTDNIFDGYKYESQMYSEEEMNELLNSLVLSIDDGVPICSSQENYIKYRNVLQGREKIYKTLEIYTEIPFEVRTLPTDDIEFCEPCYYTNFDKYDLYIFNQNSFSVYMVEEIGKKYGYSRSTNENNISDTTWLLSVHGWKYFKIGDKYVNLEHALSSNVIYGNLEVINKRKETIKEVLEKEFKKHYLLKVELDKKAVSYANVIYTVDDCISKLKSVHSSSNRSADAINSCIKSLTKLNSDLMNDGVSLCPQKK